MSNFRGQVAIFVVLVFHVFFIFFAMVVNVGLLVFHKINLQNSVDLAAYYAGMKQAEVLNAIAHVNFQMRQSWKLLNFRYRAYGMAGNSRAQIPLFCPNDYTACTLTPTPQGGENQPYNPQCAIGFCANYQSWSHLNWDETYCRNLGCVTPQEIPLVGVPSNVLSGLVGASLPRVVASAISLGNSTQSGQISVCIKTSRANWITLASFIFAYKWDMINRKLVIHGLSQGLSQSQSDFLDIEGESVRDGALLTFEKNLTSPNLESFSKDKSKFRLINSLALGGCGQVSGGRNSAPNWLQPIHVRPLYRFLDTNCNGPGSLVPKFYYFTNSFLTPGSPNIPPITNDIQTYSPELFEVVKNITVEPIDFNSPDQMMFASTVGFEKNPWCMAYVQIEAETTPKIPFSPLGSVTLKAKAIAKPFGGNIGPWYARTWPSGANVSGGFSTPFEIRTDKHLTFRSGEGILNHHQTVQNNIQNNPTNPEYLREYEYLSPNHGRYVGDPSGLKAYNTNLAWLDGIYHMTLRGSGGERLTMQHWIPIIGKAVETGDVLPWDDTNPSALPRARKLEIEAILPDQFDLSYFSIESNFFDNYVLRLRKNRYLLDNFLNEYTSPEVAIRGDLGYRVTGNWNLNGKTFDLSRFSIRDQFEVARLNRHILSRPSVREHGFNISGLGYQANTQANGPSIPSLLTSWHMAKPGDYEFKPEKFGRCSLPVGNINVGSSAEIEATPGDCIAGGRSGYSVKLVDPQSLNETMPLGGEGTSGQIRNAPSN